MGSPVVRLYQDFWANFCKRVRGYRVEPSHNAALGFTELGSTWVLSKPIALISWPYKKDPSTLIDILVNYQMTLVQQPKGAHRIASSKASVLYFRGGIARKPPVQILRFEYEPTCGLDDGDPLFHVQFGGKTSIARQSLPEPLLRHWTYANQIQSAIDSHVHIPTPRMLLPDLICFIVADHLRGVVHDLVEDTRKTVMELTSMVCDNSYARTEFWDQMPACNWYRRAPTLPAQAADERRLRPSGHGRRNS